MPVFTTVHVMVTVQVFGMKEDELIPTDGVFVCLQLRDREKSSEKNVGVAASEKAPVDLDK